MSETPSDSSGAGGVGHIQQILSLLGGQPVLLPIPSGQKGPRYKDWQKLSWDNTQDPEFRLRVPEAPLPGERLAGDVEEVWRARYYSELLNEGNVGVLLGAPSALTEDGHTWHLCSIDIDDGAAVSAFAAANPALAFTLQTVGSRGRNFWVWVEGEFPPLHKDVVFIATEDHESVRVKGKRIKKGDPDKDRPWGEWRATGGQTVIYGVHPSGGRYTTAVKNPPVRIKFAEIVWPEGLYLPWAKPAAPAPESSAVAAPPPPASVTTGLGLTEEEAEKYKAETMALQQVHGAPWTVSKKGNLAINQAFFAAFYAWKHRIIYSPEEERFWRYEGKKSGLWSEQTADNVRWDFAADIKTISDNFGEDKLINLRTTQLLNALVGMLRGCVEKWKAFERPRSAKTNRPRAIVHLQNGMLDLDEPVPLMREFAPEFMSRNQLAVAIDEKAECPRFLGELLGKAVSADDIELMQKFAGQMLIGVNLSQKLLILTGTAGGGKTTFVNIISEIIGRVNVGQLRTEHLSERFEIFRLLGKTLLIGVDVPGNFMMSEGAYVIKGLCGGDLMDAEPKNGNHCFQLKGEFNILITCNTRLKVRLDGDGDAWRRRLGIVVYESPKPAKPDPNFVQRLVAEESAGILNWMIEGAIKLLADLELTGGIVLTNAQKDRVESLLAESDSVRDFVKRGCVKAPRSAMVTGEQLLQAYVAHCEARNWNPVSGKTVSYQLPDALLEIHGATPSHDIKIGENSKAQRGYRGVSLVADSGIDEAAPGVAPVPVPVPVSPDGGGVVEPVEEMDGAPFGE